MDRMRNIALVLVFQKRTPGGQPRASRAVAAPLAKRTPVARRVGGQCLCYPGPHPGPELVPRHLEKGKRRFTIDHAVAGIPERIDEKRDAPCAARVELVASVAFAANPTLGQGAGRPRLTMAELEKLISKHEDTPRLDPVQRRLLAAVVTRVDDGIGFERQRSRGAPFHERIHVIG